MDWFVNKVDQHLFFRLWFEFSNWVRKVTGTFEKQALFVRRQKSKILWDGRLAFANKLDW